MEEKNEVEEVSGVKDNSPVKKGKRKSSAQKSVETQEKSSEGASRMTAETQRGSSLGTPTEGTDETKRTAAVKALLNQGASAPVNKGQGRLKLVNFRGALEVKDTVVDGAQKVTSKQGATQEVTEPMEKAETPETVGRRQSKRVIQNKELKDQASGDKFNNLIDKKVVTLIGE